MSHNQSIQLNTITTYTNYFYLIFPNAVRDVVEITIWWNYQLQNKHYSKIIKIITYGMRSKQP